MSLDQDLDLFFGRSSNAATQVYARSTRPKDQSAELMGTITGPYCHEIRTLPMTVSFQDLGPGPTLIARAVVPDFCPWLPEQPHLYRVRIELVVDGRVIDVGQRDWGAHRFAIRNRDFLWNAERVVLRGIGASRTVDQWPKESPPVMWVRDPDERLCQDASRRGVPVIAAISSEDGQMVARRLRGLARWPAVLIAIVKGQLPADFSPHEAIPNLILAVTADDSIGIPNWAQVVFCQEDAIERIANSSLNELPIVATRCVGNVRDIAAARAQCDRLQRDVAGIGQFAGYFIL